MSYRPQLNGFFPRDLIQKEYRKHLSSDLTVDGESYVSNQSVENLLNNVALMKSIKIEMMESFLQSQNRDDDGYELRQQQKYHKPSKDRDYEID